LQLIGWYKDFLGFTNPAATTLYDTQMIKDKETLSKLDDNAIENIFKAVRKDTGQLVAKLATMRIKSLCFWIKHQDRTSRMVGTTASHDPALGTKTYATISRGLAYDDPCRVKEWHCDTGCVLY
jgi:hypothetical protein